MVTLISRRITLLAVMLAMLAACGKKEEASAPAASMAAPAMASMAAASYAQAPVQEESAPTAEASTAADSGTGTSDAQVTSATTSYTDAQRQFIRTANLTAEVKDVYQAAIGIEDAATRVGGFVVKNNISTENRRTERKPLTAGRALELTEYVVHGELVVRVPTLKTQEFLRSITQYLLVLERRSFEARDVALDLLRQQLNYRRSQNSQRKLGAVAQASGEIEQKVEAINAQEAARYARDEAELARRELVDQVQYSTITLTLDQAPQVSRREVADINAQLESAGPGFASRLAEALGMGWQGALALVILLAHLWPLWLVAALGGLLYWLRHKRAV